VNVGIYFDLRQQLGADDSSRLYSFTLEMCEEADRLGCHSIWLSEHHLFEDGYLPQPLTMAAAVAARTRHARIGTAVVIAPLHHPAELAEQAIVVDLISGGRLDLGLGAGYRAPEFDLFDADLSCRYSTTDARAVEILALTRTVTPRPVQDPIPVWLGYGGPRGAARAGRLGLPLLTASPSSWPPYLGGLVEGGHEPSVGRMAGGISGWVSDDPEADWPVVSKHVAEQVDSYRRHMVEGTDQTLPRPVDVERLRAREPLTSALGYFMLDTPQAMADRICEATAGAPVETVYLWASIACMPEALVAKNIDTICTKLAPLLRGQTSCPSDDT
jgi:alkanesulfonate monooxygenase SsuD/methylene tetrahydromethanopterin reductase-like flavin-dependent oxidoreductase (luciferase family)